MIKKLTVFIAAIVAVFVIAMPAYAAPIGTGGISNAVTSGQQSSSGSKCGDTQTQLIACDGTTGLGTINSLISITISVLTVIIGIVAVGGLAYAGVLYASARDNQTQVSEARTVIRNVVIGLLLYGFTIAIINWLIPGSVIGGGSSSASPSPSVSPSPSTSAGTVTQGTQ
ncbi:MAG: rane protein of unknown function [Candidatus Saccharibacteria bacterium]|nr:rane protein of unknown function [Candidatus Saccharibacteria bacterium]